MSFSQDPPSSSGWQQSRRGTWRFMHSAKGPFSFKPKNRFDSVATTSSFAPSRTFSESTIASFDSGISTPDDLTPTNTHSKFVEGAVTTSSRSTNSITSRSDYTRSEVFSDSYQVSDDDSPSTPSPAKETLVTPGPTAVSADHLRIIERKPSNEFFDPASSMVQQPRIHLQVPPPVLFRNFSYNFTPTPAPSTSPARDLILPNSLIGPLGEVLEKVETRSSTSSFDQSLAAAEKLEPRGPTGQQDIEAPKLGYFERSYKQFRAIYAPTESPPLVFPSGPTDAEKITYLKTHRIPVYAIGVFSFVSLSAGMWLFVIAAPAFYWFGLFSGLLQIYLLVSYCVSILGKDFDIEKHNQILKDYPITEETAPSVDVYLPCCKEPMEIIANTYKYVKALKYPASKLNVFVLDDGDMEEVKQLATSYGFTYITRDDKPRLKKAGNLRWAFARTSGDFFNIYDADFCPRADFLLETVPEMMASPKTAIVQTPQFFRATNEQTWIEIGAGSIQELFYRLVQVNRNRWGASICVGSNALYRRQALIEVGGTAEIGFSEDVHTGFYAVTRGWYVRYVPLCLACGICPDTPRSYFSQQMRWCMGSTTLLTNKDFWVSNLSLVQKICYMSGMMYYSAFALSIFLNPTPGILLLWVSPSKLKYYNLAFVMPSLIYSLFTFRMWARASWGMNVQFIMVIQSYAYLTAIKDRLLGTALAWVPSGDTKAHKNNKYRNMRILAWVWTLTWQGALTAGVAYRVAVTGIDWWNTIPLLMLDTFNLFLVHRFLFCTGN